MRKVVLDILAGQGGVAAAAADTAYHTYVNVSSKVETHVGKIRQQGTRLQVYPEVSGPDWFSDWESPGFPKGRRCIIQGPSKLGLSVFLVQKFSWAFAYKTCS